MPASEVVATLLGSCTLPSRCFSLSGLQLVSGDDALLPSAQQLQFLWAVLAQALARVGEGPPQGSLGAATPWHLSNSETLALLRGSAAAICAAAPAHPLGQEALALLVPGGDAAGFRRGLDLARQLNSPYWVANLAYTVSALA